MTAPRDPFDRIDPDHGPDQSGDPYGPTFVDDDRAEAVEGSPGAAPPAGGPPEHPWDALRRSVRTHPREWALGGVVAAAAVATGLVFGGLVNREDGVGGAPSASASPTVSASASIGPSPSASASASASASPSASVSASVAASASADATTAPSQAPTPEATPAVGENPDYDITGAWVRMPSLPDAGDYAISDTVVLAPPGPTTSEGELVVLRWGGTGAQGGPNVVAFDSGTETWREIDTDDFSGGTDASFGIGSDGRLYGFAATLDPSEQPWSAVPQGVASMDEVYAGDTLDAGPDGRIYRPSTDGGDGASLFIFDPKTGERSESAVIDANRPTCVLGGPDAVFAMTEFDLMTYDPARDRWEPIVTPTPAAIDCWRAGIGPDGRLYVKAETPGSLEIGAWMPGSSEWETVQPPTEASANFRPHFITWDDELWAIGEREIWRFDPAG